MTGAGFTEVMTAAVMIVVEASGAEPEEVLEALPHVMEKLKECYQKEQPDHIEIVQAI